jgi:hypothetical protein
MNRKEFIGDPVPAIVVPFGELPFNPDELPKALAAFPAPVTIKLCHTSHHMSAIVIDKLCDIISGRKPYEIRFGAEPFLSGNPPPDPRNEKGPEQFNYMIIPIRDQILLLSIFMSEVTFGSTGILHFRRDKLPAGV